MSDLVPVEALTQGGQRFHCDRLRVELRADVCVKRSLAAFRGGRSQHRAGPQRWALYPSCAGCAVGSDVRRRLGVEGTPAPAPNDRTLEHMRGRR